MPAFVTDNPDWTKRAVAPTEEIAINYRHAGDVRLSTSERNRAILRVIVATIKIGDPGADLSNVTSIENALERLREVSSSPDGRARITAAFYPPNNH